MHRQQRTQPQFRGAAECQRWRAYQWCIKRTERDARNAAAKRQPISQANLRRLRMRRWAWVSNFLNGPHTFKEQEHGGNPDASNPDV